MPIHTAWTFELFFLNEAEHMVAMDAELPAWPPCGDKTCNSLIVTPTLKASGPLSNMQRTPPPRPACKSVRFLRASVSSATVDNDAEHVTWPRVFTTIESVDAWLQLFKYQELTSETLQDARLCQSERVPKRTRSRSGTFVFRFLFRHIGNRSGHRYTLHKATAFLDEIILFLGLCPFPRLCPKVR